MTTLNDACLEGCGAAFMDAAPEKRLSLLERIDREQHDYMDSRAEGAPVHYFRMLKELTLLGYFTSEIGYTQAMRYAETPGRYDPCAPVCGRRESLGRACVGTCASSPSRPHSVPVRPRRPMTRAGYRSSTAGISMGGRRRSAVTKPA